MLDKLVKHRLPDKVANSPAFFKKAKRDLDGLVRECGMASHFLTLTMNETGHHASVEYRNIADIMQAWHASFEWRDAPLECNRAFIARFELILQEYILDDRHRILGNVADYAVRYECQGRGSLHVHMVIWLKTPEDITALDRKIISCVLFSSRLDLVHDASSSLRCNMFRPHENILIPLQSDMCPPFAVSRPTRCRFVPADYDEELGDFIEPNDALQRRLYLIARHKNQHKCDVMSCRKTARCTLLFPNPHHDRL